MDKCSLSVYNLVSLTIEPQEMDICVFKFKGYCGHSYKLSQWSAILSEKQTKKNKKVARTFGMLPTISLLFPFFWSLEQVAFEPQPTY